MNRFTLGVLTLVISSALSACSSGPRSSYSPSPVAPPSNDPLQTTITGVLVAPDGLTPIANATVWIPIEGTATSLELGSLADGCPAPPVPALVSTCTDSLGNFTLSATLRPKPKPKLFFKKGTFSSQFAFTPKATNTKLKSIRLTADPALGAPKMAVVKGTFDNVELLLSKLGFIANTSYFIYDSGSRKIADLFVDTDKNGKIDLFDYSTVYFNCGLKEGELLTPEHLTLLKQYVQEGGKIYASDQAYDVVEQAFPEYIDFVGSEETPENQPESQNAAQVGLANIISAATVDPLLKTWLSTVKCGSGIGSSCLTADGKAKIEGFSSGWVVMQGIHPDKKDQVRIWATGPISYGTQKDIERPLTVSFPIGKGKVLYTSYHTEPGNTSTILPQDRILQYLVFDF